MEAHSISGTQGWASLYGPAYPATAARLNPQQGGRLKMKGFAYCISQVAPY